MDQVCFTPNSKCKSDHVIFHLVLNTKTKKKKSHPALTQEAYRSPRSTYSLCWFVSKGVLILTGGEDTYLIWGDTYPGRGIPTLDGGIYIGQGGTYSGGGGGYLPWIGVPTLVGAYSPGQGS